MEAKMKKWNRYSLLFVLAVSGLLLTGAGYAGEDTIYADYSGSEGWMVPKLSLVFRGWKDGIYPWEVFAAAGKPAEAAGNVQEETGNTGNETGDGKLQMLSGNASDGTKQEESKVLRSRVSGNAVPGNQVSGNSAQVSGNSAQVSGNGAQISGNSAQVSGNGAQVSGNISQVSGNASGSAEEEAVSERETFVAADGSIYDKFGQLIGNMQEGPQEAQEPSGEAAGSQTDDGRQTGEDEQTEESLPAETGQQEGQEGETGGQPETSVPDQAAAESSASETDAEQDSSEEAVRPFAQVSEDYFADALFIGDSRTVGLQEYGGFPDSTTFYARTSLTIYDLFDEPEKFIRLPDGTKATLEEALGSRQFGKIYLMLGINELGRGSTESFFRVYADAVNRIRQLQPDALIFIQGIMRVGGEKSSTDAVFNNANINERNQAISRMADGRNIFYLEVNDAVCDDKGDLISDYTFDQIHLKAKYYQLWKDYLFAHGILKE